MTEHGTATLGIGIDVVEYARLRRILDRGPTFFTRYFAPSELAHASGADVPSLACAFAAKEAFVKALGVGILGRVEFRDIELVRRGVCQSLVLGASAATALERAGFATAHVSTALAPCWALATVMLDGLPPSC